MDRTNEERDFRLVQIKCALLFTLFLFLSSISYSQESQEFNMLQIQPVSTNRILKLLFVEEYYKRKSKNWRELLQKYITQEKLDVVLCVSCDKIRFATDGNGEIEYKGFCIDCGEKILREYIFNNPHPNINRLTDDEIRVYAIENHYKYMPMIDRHEKLKQFGNEKYVRISVCSKCGKVVHTELVKFGIKFIHKGLCANCVIEYTSDWSWLNVNKCKQLRLQELEREKEIRKILEERA